MLELLPPKSHHYFGQWAESHHISHDTDGSLCISMEVPISWPKQIGLPEREEPRMVPFTVTYRIDPMGSDEIFTATIKILNNFDELHAEATGRYNQEHDVYMFDHFHAWLTGYIDQLQSDSVAFDQSLLSRLYDTLHQNGDHSFEQIRDTSVLDFILLDESESRRHTSKHLAIGWQTSREALMDLFDAVSKNPVVWQTAGIPDKPGNWQAFFAYCIQDIHESMERLMPYLVEAAVSFSSEIAPKIIWDETQKAFDAGVEDPTYIALSIYGYEIQEHGWFQAHTRELLDSMTPEEPLLEPLIRASKLRNLRVAQRAIRDEPIADTLHLHANITKQKTNSTNEADIVILDDGVHVECPFVLTSTSRIYEHWDEFIDGWIRGPGASFSTMPMPSTFDAWRNKATQALTLSSFIPRNQAQNIESTIHSLSDAFPFFEKYCNWFNMKKRLEEYAAGEPMIWLLLDPHIMPFIELRQEEITLADGNKYWHLKGHIRLQDYLSDTSIEKPIEIIFFADSMWIECPIPDVSLSNLEPFWSEYVESWDAAGGAYNVSRPTTSRVDEATGEEYRRLTMAIEIPRNDSADLYQKLFALPEEHGQLVEFTDQFILNLGNQKRLR